VSDIQLAAAIIQQYAKGVQFSDPCSKDSARKAAEVLIANGFRMAIDDVEDLKQRVARIEGYMCIPGVNQ
jgi:hypothetical protein